MVIQYSNLEGQHLFCMAKQIAIYRLVCDSIHTASPREWNNVSCSANGLANRDLISTLLPTKADHRTPVDVIICCVTRFGAGSMKTSTSTVFYRNSLVSRHLDVVSDQFYVAVLNYVIRDNNLLFLSFDKGVTDSVGGGLFMYINLVRCVIQVTCTV